MIAGLVKGNDFGGLVRYLFHGKYGKAGIRGHLLGGTILAGGPDDLTAHFEALQRLRPDVINPVHHVHISLAPGETLTVLQWLRVAERISETMRWGHYAVVGHGDTNQEHIHIIGTRLSEGRVFPEQLRDQRLIMKCLRKIEVEYRLRRVESPVSPRTPHGRVPRAERKTNRERTMTKSGKVPQKQLLRETIDSVIAAGFRKGGVLIEMKKLGFEPYTTWRNGHPVGICWMDTNGNRFPGARLGTEYAGKRFFERIGGLNGATEQRTTFDPNKLTVYDVMRRWDHILRQLDGGHRPMAGSPLR